LSSITHRAGKADDKFILKELLRFPAGSVPVHRADAAQAQDLFPEKFFDQPAPGLRGVRLRRMRGVYYRR
jgi:hypothetical protein